MKKEEKQVKLDLLSLSFFYSYKNERSKGESLYDIPEERNDVPEKRNDTPEERCQNIEEKSMPRHQIPKRSHRKALASPVTSKDTGAGRSVAGAISRGSGSPRHQSSSKHISGSGQSKHLKQNVPMRRVSSDNMSLFSVKNEDLWQPRLTDLSGRNGGPLSLGVSGLFSCGSPVIPSHINKDAVETASLVSSVTGHSLLESPRPNKDLTPTISKGAASTQRDRIQQTSSIISTTHEDPEDNMNTTEQPYNDGSVRPQNGAGSIGNDKIAVTTGHDKKNKSGDSVTKQKKVRDIRTNR